ncbi:MAG TPA: M14 family zinc carboxypeptidase [Thermoanaerobaculia bacterium]|nr:M14 family zinc carboxypeptidase [Thermoanaerobaculia bacterium]
MNARAAKLLSLCLIAVAPLAAQAPPPPAPPAAPAAPAVIVHDEPIPPGEPGGPDLWAPDRAEPGSVEKIKEYTTGREYLPESVAYVPDSATVPSPSKVLGHLIGAPDELSRVADVHGYFRKLAAATDRVKVATIGTSEEGREILLVLVSDAQNLAELDRYKALTARLADPRRTSRGEAHQLAADGKVFYWLTGGLHSTETGSPEMLMELAYRLAVSEKPEIQAIRKNAIVLITPILEPDGRDRQVDWYYRHVRSRKGPIEDFDDILSPPYWGHYVFHDNNRDGMQITQAVTRAFTEAYFDFHPQITHDLHESLPLLYIMTGYGPYNHAIDPVTISEWTQLGFHESGALAAQGLPGVWTWGFWDGWWPGYLNSVANTHHSVGRFYETFGNGSAGTYDRDLSKSRFAGRPVTDVQWYRPLPPKKKLRWSLRNNTNYMEAGVLSALEYAALHRQELLENFWTKGNRSLEKGKTEAPYAWIFPPGAPEQRDPARLAYLLNHLRQQRIEIHRLSQELKIGTKSWPAGSYAVRMDQPYRDAAVTFLEEQKFPADEPNRPYDDVAWTWTLLYGVAGEPVADRKVLDAPMEPVTADVAIQGGVAGAGDVFLLRDTGQTALLEARVLLGTHQVDAAEVPFTAGGESYPAGSWIVQAPRDAVEAVARQTGLSFTATAELPSVRRHLADLPRLAVLHNWIDTQDAGWVRYTFDRAKVPYTLINDDDVKRGNLAERFDVILVPDTGGELSDLIHGIDPKFSPLPYTRTPEFPSLGIPDASEDITGGMGFEGMLNLQRFVRGGGVLIALANAGRLPVEGGLVRGVGATFSGRGATHGSVLRAKVVRPEHPIAYGYEELTTIFLGSSPGFDVPKSERGRVVVQLGTKKPDGDDEEKKGGGGSGIEVEDLDAPPAAVAAKKKDEKKEDSRLVLSGAAKGLEDVDGKPAILDLPAGKGRVILFSFNPLYRYLNLADFRFVYNALLNWNDLPQ